MDEMTFNVRVQSKIDNYSNWDTNNPILLKGEIAIVEIPDETGIVQNEPTYMIKVGDGVSNFKTLKWISATAADVYEWAKSSQKPTYTAQEISGLSDYISGEINDTNTKYQIVKEGNMGFKLQSQEVGAEGWTDVNTITLVAPKVVITTGETQGTIKVDGTEVAVAGLKSGAYADITNYQEKITFNTPYNASSNKAATMTDINNAMAGLSGAMHYVGESSTNPSGGTVTIAGKPEYIAISGDVVTYQQKEYVYNGTAWKELGDETSYAIKGSITDSDIASGANIAMNKIAGLETELGKKANDSELSTIAKTGKITDLQQDSGTFIILKCGSSTENI